MSLLITLGLGSAGVAPPTPPAGDTPWMHMVLPIVTVTIGPDYATDINAALGQTVDAHDHSPTKGKPVPVAGLDINADLPFAGHSALNLDSTQYNIRNATVTDSIGYLYFDGVDLYVIDGNGVTIQMTSGGSVNVTGTGGWTGDYGTGNSTANYIAASKTFHLYNDSGANKVGFLSVGDIYLRQGNSSAATAEVVLKSPLSGATGGYTLQFPISPTSAGFGGTENRLLLVDHTGAMVYGPAAPGATTKGLRAAATSGTVSADVDGDGVTINTLNTSTSLGVIAGSIGTTQLTDGGVTAAKLHSAATGISSSSSAYTNATGSYTDVFIIDCAIVATGLRPVCISLQAQGSGFVSYIGASGGDCKFQLLIDGTSQGEMEVSDGTVIPPGAISLFLSAGLSAGTHHIQLQGKHISAGTAEVNYCKLVAYEI